MVRNLPLDAIDSRVVLTAYAGVVGAAGIFTIGWSTIWIHEPLFGNIWGWHSVVRVYGSLVVAAALCAFGGSRIKDPVDRRRALLSVDNRAQAMAEALRRHLVSVEDLKSP